MEAIAPAPSRSPSAGRTIVPASPYVVRLEDADRAELEAVSRRGSAEYRLVLRARIVLLAAGGLVLSIPAIMLVTGLLKSFLFEIKPDDPVSLSVAAISLVATAALAGYLPARNASRIDPMAALRHE